jgi:hypothetical protein
MKTSSVLFALALLVLGPGVAAAKPPPWAHGGGRGGDAPRGDDGPRRGDDGPRRGEDGPRRGRDEGDRVDPGRPRFDDRGDRGRPRFDDRGPRRPPRDEGYGYVPDDRGPPPPPEYRRRMPQDEARDAVAQGRRVPMQEVVQRIQRRTPGRILNAYPETDASGRARYRVRWGTQDGRRIDYLVDAQTGEIVGRED